LPVGNVGDASLDSSPLGNKTLWNLDPRQLQLPALLGSDDQYSPVLGFQLLLFMDAIRREILIGGSKCAVGGLQNFAERNKEEVLADNFMK